ncbi:MAG: TetR/AcrR family transcriptional regulator [Bacteroidota bacterium]
MAEQISHKIRRQREIEMVKADVLQAARDLAIREGWTKVSIRKIADIIQFTPPVIYQHFKNKEAILIELELSGFRQLQYALEEARESQSDPKEQLQAITAVYWDWAFHHAELYHVMFNLDGVRSTPPSTKSLRNAGACVVESLRQMSLFSTDMDELFFHWWALVHGYVSLVMSGQAPGMNTKMKTYLLDSVKRFSQTL